VRRLLFCLLAALATGCSATVRTPPVTLGLPGVTDTISWSKGLRYGIEDWRRQFRERFGDDPIIVSCHGDDDGHGHFVLCPDAGPLLDAESVCRTLHAAYPKRRILVVSCNVGHHRLTCPGVVYPLDYVWSQPGPDAQFCLSELSVITCIGDLSEFTVNP